MVTPQPHGKWVFDRLPPSGARRGGDPSEHAFNANLATFVREVIQNANDQAIDRRSRRSAIHFDHFEIIGEELLEFLDASDAKNLFSHIQAASSSGSTTKLQYGLRDAQKNLSLLRIADYHTHGLSGDEDAENTHFRALCKDTLVSFKQGDGAGGSYGLGKSVLWSFSSLSTVIFASTFSTGEAPPRFRLIGRTEIPSHRHGDQWFGGSGWFGLPKNSGPGMRAESIWDKPAQSLAHRLKLDRREGSGTSILVVGFRDPTTDEGMSTDELLSEIRQTAAREFWPALSWPGAGSPLEIFVQGRPVCAREVPEVRPFVDCWTSSEQDSPSNVQHHQIAIELPRRREADKGIRVNARLSIKIGEALKQSEGPTETAVFRGPGMVVERWVHNDLRRASRPVHAILACGLARSPGGPSDGDHALEDFLRCCEPPGHDTWRATQAVKNAYIQGYGKALKHLRTQVDDLLRKAVLREDAYSTEAPEHIRKLFPLVGPGSNGGTHSAFIINSLQAKFDGTSWEFEGAIRAASPGRAWRAVIKLFEVDDDGSPVGEPITIASIVRSPEGASEQTQDGSAVIAVDSQTREVKFIGQSVRLHGQPETFGAICVEVNAQVVQP